MRSGVTRKGRILLEKLSLVGVCHQLIIHNHSTPRMPNPKLKSAVSGMSFPALPAARAGQALAMQFQLDRSQWLPADALLENQLAQLRNVLVHASSTVPYYRELFSEHGVSVPKALDADFLRRLPISRRAMVREAGERLRSESVPKDHGKVRATTTSGATGTPVKVWGTDLTSFLWRAFTLRDHLWHERDLSAKLGAIRWAKKGFAAAPDGMRWDGWGDAVDLIYESGSSCMLNVVTPVAQQVDWLLREQPKYLVSFPSNLAALAAHCLDRGIRFPGLTEVRTVGEMLSAEQRALFCQAWDCKVVDMYTCEEAGYLALQCPLHEHYHVQSENVIVEIVGEDGTPCSPGQAGRVLVTTLHNFASPLIRYELGDFAEPGEPCPCGRGLQVLMRLRGRTRNRLRMPDGRSEFPHLGEHGQIAGATGVKVRQFQFIQRSPEEIEVKLVTERAFSAEESDRVRRLVQRNLGHPFRIKITHCDEIPKGPGGKLEEFVSEVGS